MDETKGDEFLFRVASGTTADDLLSHDHLRVMELVQLAKDLLSSFPIPLTSTQTPSPQLVQLVWLILY